MIGETPVTVVGNLTADPELRYTPTGTAVANFTVASTPRMFDRQAGQWTDGDPLFLRCTAWRELAEHTAKSLGKGTRVVVAGRLRQRSYTTSDGQSRTTVEVEVDEAGASLRFVTATLSRTARAGTHTGAGREEDAGEVARDG